MTTQKFISSQDLKKIPSAAINIACAAASQGPKHLIRSISSVFERITDWLLNSKHAQYGLAVTRIVLGLMALSMLMANFSTRYYTFGNASKWTGDLDNPVSDFPTIFPFSISHALLQSNAGLNILYILLVFLSITIILGWRLRINLPIFFVLWVGFIESQDMVGDQSDNIVRMTLLAMIFADSGLRWSLDSRRRLKAESKGSIFARLKNGAPVLPAWLTNLAHNLVLVVLTCQVCFVYVSGALYKSAGDPWKQGYAVYDTLNVLQFSTWPELAQILSIWAPGVAALSIGTIVVQVAFPGALLHRWTRIPAMIAIFGFHLGIAFFMGLPWFSMAMIAIDFIFIRDVTWRRLISWVKRSVSGREASPKVAGEAKESEVIEASELVRV
ncbi:HTTM domain-containing protein [Glutamicibacter protophormiae]|uniref:HTTM domain-containing protein n=1 Tax=Glutamicibacter protophormiae TaxID=37930 RepID=UPI00331D3D36